MKGRLIALDHWHGREAAALMVDGRLEDLLIDPVAGPHLGTVFAARVDRPLKGQGGAIVSWPGPDAGSGFLRHAKGLAPGSVLPVQVTGYAEPGKAPPVSDRLLFKSRYAIVTPGAPGLNVSRAIKDEARRDALDLIAREEMAGEAAGLILRSAAMEAADEDVRDDIAAMRAAWDAIGTERQEPGLMRAGDGAHLTAWREWTEPAHIDTGEGSFETHGILDAIDALKSPRALAGETVFYVEETRALSAIDINTGADASPAAGLKANLAAIRALPRELRLRGIGGQITIDFAPLAKRDRRQIETALRAAFRADAVATEVIGWTPLGHMELKRKRERPLLVPGPMPPPLPCPICDKST
ncbi:MAG: ribonuclease E/G [Pseudomonadota bacterium]